MTSDGHGWLDCNWKLDTQPAVWLPTGPVVPDGALGPLATTMMWLAGSVLREHQQQQAEGMSGVCQGSVSCAGGTCGTPRTCDGFHTILTCTDSVGAPRLSTTLDDDDDAASGNVIIKELGIILPKWTDRDDEDTRGVFPASV